MKKVLILIQDMGSGGSQKSLLSFLYSLEQNKKNIEYEIDLIIAKPEGVFLSQIPKYVNVITTPKTLLWLGTPLWNPLLRKYISVQGIIGKIQWIFRKKFKLFKPFLNDEQKLWSCWRKMIPINNKEYDIAISYMNGFLNYYVIEKVKATKKVLWIHNEYQKIGYNLNFDKYFYKRANKIITISKECLNSFCEVFPEFKNKISILENITIRADIFKKANKDIAYEFQNFKGLKLLSIGRLSEQKNFDLAIEAANELKRKNIDFCWLILGEGEERKKLQEKIDKYKLSNFFKMIGVKENPYSYIKECDVFVQTSRYEGKSIVLDEAKIFAKPIVVTNYPTVYDSICNGKNGIIVEMNGIEVANGIELLLKNKSLKYNLIKMLEKNNMGNENELEKYIKVML